MCLVVPPDVGFELVDESEYKGRFRDSLVGTDEILVRSFSMFTSWILFTMLLLRNYRVLFVGSCG